MDLGESMLKLHILASKNVLAAVVVVFLIVLEEVVGLPGLGLSKAQEIAAIIVVIAAILWVSEWVPLYVVSFLILSLELIWLGPELNASGQSVASSVFFSAFFSDIILLFMGGFVLSSLMQKYGLDLRFAQSILDRTHGNAQATLLGIIFACAFLSMWISNTATTAMMLTIVFPLLKKMPVEHPFRIALVLSIPFACNIGGIATPIGTPPNAIALSYLNKAGISISFAKWMLLTLPFVLALLAILWLLLLRLYPAKGIVLSIESRETGRFGPNHLAALSIFALTALGWLFSTQLGVTTGTVALFPLVVCFWFGLLDTSDFRKLPWDILYIISGGLALGVALSATGLGEVLVAQLPENARLLFILGVLTAAVMSTVMSNTATAGLIIPLVIALDTENSFLITLVLALAMSCSLAMALPVTTPPNAIAFSSRALTSRDMILAGGIMTVIGLLVVLVAGPLYWGLFTRTGA